MLLRMHWITGIALLGLLFFWNIAITVVVVVSLLLGWIRVLFQTEYIEVIEIDEVNRQLKVQRSGFGKKKDIELDIDRIEVMYQLRVGSKGALLTTCSFRQDNKEVFHIDPGLSEWSESDLNEIMVEVDRIKHNQS